MAESIVSDLVGRLLGYLGQSAVGKIASYVGGSEKLKELEQTMMMIQARLFDAERLQEGEGGALAKSWLKRLKNVLYRLEDLFEEVSFAANQLPNKVVCFPTMKLSFLKMNIRMTQEVESIMRELEGITSDMNRLHLRVDSIDRQHSLNLLSSRESHSFVLEEDIIGRDEIKNEIVKMLMDIDRIGEGLSVIPIVGIGGLGKTTLAQLIYNDNNVQQHFECKYWVCISEISGLEELLGKIFKSIAGCACGQLNIEQLQSWLQEAIKGKKYLLILDDVWDEDRERWLSLRRLLCGGKQGSKIIVTSRSKVVALNMGTIKPYELEGLPEEKSWLLFRSLAFRKGLEEQNPNLTAIGREIVKKCANVPLAIRTVAGILYTKDTEEEWMCFKDSELREIELMESSIMSTLKLSYDHLPSQLKQCFAYCALFPKGYEFNKQRLIWLWMSQGFVEPVGRNQSPDDVGHAFFMELFRRCFFQDDKTHFKTCYKMHDLMHDLALIVGDECLLINRTLEHMNESIKHVHFINVESSLWKAPSSLLVAPHMRSYLLSTRFLEKFSTSSINSVFSSLMLRALDLGEGIYKSLPNSIGKLKHLRYLRVRVFSSHLPSGITRLQNLQTLDLRNSTNLRKLPSGFCRLRSLRHLQIRNSSLNGGALVDMPQRFGQLTSLQALDKFIVGRNNGLDVLGSMYLAGEFQIFFREWHLNMKTEAKLARLKDKRITDLLFNWSFLHDEEPDKADMVLECLQPPSTLITFQIQKWKGVRFPSWGIDQVPCLLPNLVSIIIEGCIRCQYLPSFSRLPRLKFLTLAGLPALEYIEMEIDIYSFREEAYFPALQELYLKNLYELKGWSSIMCDQDIVSSSIAPEYLPNIINCFTRLQQLSLSNLLNLNSLPEWIGNLSQLNCLYIQRCPKLTALPESFCNLTALTKLEIKGCPLIQRRCVGPYGEDWRLINHIPEIKFL